MSRHLSYVEAIVVGACQGVTELFPVSSLGHSVLVPALVGGRWAQDLDVSAPESPYLAFIVGLHVATAAALLVFFWRDWVTIVGGFVTSVRHRRVSTTAERLAWLIVLATIPVGIAGLALEHLFRTTLGRPIPAAAFLAVNGIVLYAGERLRRRTPAVVGGAPEDGSSPPDQRVAALPMGQGVLIGSAQILALLPGISRSGITMVAGLWRGLNHEEAARFSFLLATPVIFAAGVLKIPDFTGHLGDGIRGQALAGAGAAFIGALLSTKFLTRYFQSNRLNPFGIYCLVFGVASIVRFA